MRDQHYRITNNPFFHLIILSFVLFGLAWLAIASLTFFSNDIGLRYLQIRMLVAQQWQSLAIPYPVGIDPHFEHTPYYYAYSLVNGRLYFNISLIFPLLGSFLFVLWGKAGLVATPVIGSLMAGWGIYLLAKMSGMKRPYLLLWGSIFSTPLIFYTLHLWDHSLGTGFVVLGMALAAQGKLSQRQRPTIWGGILLGVSLHTRPELYLFVVVLAISWLITTWPEWRSILPLIGGALFGFIPAAILETIWTGHPIGFPIAVSVFGYGLPEAYPVEAYSEVVITEAMKIGRLLFHIESRDPLTFGATMLVLAGMVLLVFALRIPKYRKTAVILTGIFLTLAGYVVWGIVAWQELVYGFVSTFPLLGFSLAFVAKQEDTEKTAWLYRFVLFTTLLFLTGMVFIWPSFGGTQWGARYLLPAYPLMFFLAIYSVFVYIGRVKRPYARTLKKVAVLLILASIILQGLGIRHVYAAVAEEVEYREQIDALLADVIVTNHPFLPSFMTSLENKTFFYVKNDADLLSLLPQFINHDIRHIAVLPIKSGDLTLPNKIDGIQIQKTGTTVYELQPAQN